MLKVDGIYKKFKELYRKIDNNLSPSEQLELLDQVYEDINDLRQQAYRDKNEY